MSLIYQYPRIVGPAMPLIQLNNKRPNDLPLPVGNVFELIEILLVAVENELIAPIIAVYDERVAVCFDTASVGSID